MFDSIRNRLIIIGLLIVASGYFLFPRSITTRVRTASGAMKDTVETRIPIKRGLDLQGGMHLELELDQSKQVSSDVKRDIELALQVLRKRIDEFGVEEPLIQKQGDSRIVVELAGITDPDRAKEIVQQSAFLEFRLTDETNALDKSLPAMDRVLRNLGISGAAAPGEKAKPSAVQELLGGDTTARADSAKPDSAATDSASTGSGILEDLIQPSGQLPGQYLVKETAYPRVDSLLRIPEVKRTLPRSVELYWASQPVSLGVEPYRYLYALDSRSMVTGDRLVDAQAQLDPISNGPIVTFLLDRTGGKKFAEGTGRHIGDYMAIVLDGEVQGQPPVIQSEIGRNGQITLQGRSMADAQDLALTLRAGSLPIPLKIVAEGQVGASLGADSISGGVTAGVVGTLLVILIMVGYYRLSGALAVLALMLYLLFSLAGLAALGATLTLPGLAGLVLSVGIAVDANVLIFERIREELQHGKSVRLSVDEGFKHAMNAIVDSNVSTVLTALFLFQFGTGPVKGFAVTLIIGIVASMITAIFVTRTFFLLWLQRRPEMATLSI
jgi:preprotein translocase subunit SecD